jgi:antirestriction protein ArdC
LRACGPLQKKLGAWGNEGNAMEELAAELGAAFLSADLDLTPQPRADHASYFRLVARGLEERQAGDLYGGFARAAGNGFLHGLRPLIDETEAA